jgi:predicted ATPase
VIRTIAIRNYKSVDSLDLELGRVNLFIGENGCGKTNILEAIGLAAASAAGRLENEFLIARGIRIAEPSKMRSGFTNKAATEQLLVCVSGETTATKPRMVFPAFLQHDNSPYGQWADEASQEFWQHLSPAEAEVLTSTFPKNQDFASALQIIQNRLESIGLPRKLRESAPNDLTGIILLRAILSNAAKEIGLNSFITYTPHEEALRDLSRESHIEPIGLHGEGLFKLLKNLTADQLEELQRHLRLIHWFEGFQLSEASHDDKSIHVVDQYLGEGIKDFDQRSANEGFLFLLLYAALLISSHTPKFFAVDNVDASLNPKLSASVIKMFVEATQKHGRQVLLTTHNPGALDGLDLQDPEQRLFVVYRNVEGRTRVRRIQREGGADLPRLSEAFLQGYLGGLPNHF